MSVKDLTTITKEEIASLIEGKVIRHYGKDIQEATKEQLFDATAQVIRDFLVEKYVATRSKDRKQRGKKLYYLSMEFLMGRSLMNNLYNLGLTEAFEGALKGFGSSLEELYYDDEDDAALGNGGLGRLAACYMDALANGDYSAVGYSILYEYGLFKQRIVEGQQVELPDSWLDSGRSWLVSKPSEAFEVHFGGEVVETWEDNQLRVQHTGYETVLAIPNDMLVCGYRNDTVNPLRLWQAKSPSEMNISLFNSGAYLKASESQATAEVISKVLYPEDNHWEGKSLRLKQQYFFVSASVQEILRNHMQRYGRLDSLPDHVVIHINDTHPTMVIPELMRLMMDVYGQTWDDAWEITTNTVAYTNHTVMSEALEKWPQALLKQVQPRLYSIIAEINRRFCDALWTKYPGEWGKISNMAIMADDQVRMANLAIVGSFSVNGVSALHSQILKDDVFHDFYRFYPDKFGNVTNGIAYRRWLGQSNPELTALIEECTGADILRDATKMEGFEAFANDKKVQKKFAEIKRKNKERLAKYIKENNGIDVNIDSIFDVQAKRLHEYKRQMLNVLHILNMYFELKDDPKKDVVPRTFIFGAKAAPGYYMAKQIIRLIVAIGDMVNNDPDVNEKMKVVYLEDYRVTVAEILMPATELSEQISIAGREASGTGNMKFMVNGALTIGTLDGANVEIHDQVGDDNMFLFGLKTPEVKELQNRGYNPLVLYQTDARISRILNLIQTGVGRDGHKIAFPEIVNSLILGDHGRGADTYMVLADFADYIRAHEDADKIYRDQSEWNKRAIINVAKSYIFAADRSIADYNDRIWHMRALSNE